MKHRVRSWVSEHSASDEIEPELPVFSIGKAAQLTGLSESALRKYEAAGLILFHRTDHGHRRLSLEDITRIKIIQKLIKENGLNLEGIRRLWALLPCWELKSCSEEARKNCPILSGANDPCWVIYKDEGGCDGDSCHDCEVYRMASSCTEDLKSLLLDLLVRERRKK